MNQLLIAKIKSCYKKEGFLLIIPYSGFHCGYFNLKSVYVDVFGDLRKFYVEQILSEGKEFYLKFLNFDKSSDVEFLIGKSVFIDSNENIFFKKDTFSYHDYLGYSVCQGKNNIGEIVDILNLPANDVIIVSDVHCKEILIPAIEAIIEKIDKSNRKLYLSEEFELNDV